MESARGNRSRIPRDDGKPLVFEATILLAVGTVLAVGMSLAMGIPIAAMLHALCASLGC